MRTQHSIKNILITIFSQIIIVTLGFVSRKIFLESLGTEYLGINGLLTNVLSIMALVESGIGISIVYNLYKPLAENDQSRIIALIQLYKKVYKLLAIVVFCLSLSLYPFLSYLMKDGNSISGLSFVYLIFIAKNMISYLNAHKWSLINADQRGYILAKINLLFQILTMVVKIIILLLTKNYIFYLIIELLFYTTQNIVNGRIVNKRYPFIKTKVSFKIDTTIKENLVKNVKAMFLHNIGGFLVFGTDNLIISAFIGVATVGLYSNYTMITQQVSALASPILGGIGASVGNLIATENNEKNYSIFKVSFLVNFWVYSLSVIFLFNLLEPFISWWLGSQYILDNLAFLFILLNFYLDGMRLAISTFKNKAGLFVQDKYAPLIEGTINLFFSLLLLKHYGLAGIFMGTTISTITTVLWTQPVIVYKHIFRKPVKRYFLQYGIYLFLTAATAGITYFACDLLVKGDSFIALFFKGIVSLIVPNIIFTGIFFRSKEFQYLMHTLILLFSRFLLKRERVRMPTKQL